jgi:hypothetical protein
MHTSRFVRSLITGLVWNSAILMAPAAQAQIVWNFTTAASGWTSVDLTCGAYRDPQATYPVTWHATGGDGGGYVDCADPSNRCFFFETPAASLGDLSIYEGGQLQFSLKSTHNSWSQDNVVVLVGANGLVLVTAVIPLPVTSWTRYEIPLVAGSFHYDTKAGAVCSESDFRAVLANVTALRFPGEFGSAVQETSALDRVRLIPPWGCVACPAVDYDGDCDVDRDDFAVFAACLSGPNVPQPDATCRTRADLDLDGDVDQNDFGIFQQCYTGSRL